jgi:DNA modification methylase
LTTAEPNQTIIDVFGGSGTTSKVAKELGFDSISYEVDGKYCEIMKNRVESI